MADKNHISHISHQTGRPAFIKRISWPAIFAGLIIVLAVQLLLGLLGMSIGASTIEPTTEQNPLAGLGTGTAIWFGMSTLVALFVGSWVAGRLSGMPKRQDGLLHGVLTWGLATLATFWLVAAGVGNVVGGVAGVLGKGMAALGQSAVSVGSAVMPDMQQLQESDVLSLQNIKREAYTLLRQTGKEELQPENLAADAEAGSEEARQTASEAAKSPDTADSELSSLIDRLVSRGGDAAEEVDKEAVANVLVARTDMSQAEANATVERWENTILQARERAQDFQAQAMQKAEETGDKVAAVVTRIAGWTTLFLVLGVVVAAGGGWLGSPRDVYVSDDLYPMEHMHGAPV